MAFYGAEQVMDSIKAYMVSDFGTHLTAVQSAATSGGAVALGPVPAAPVAADIFLNMQAVDFGKPVPRKIAMVLTVNTYDPFDIPNGLSMVGISLTLIASEPSGRVENIVRRLGRYIEAANRLFDADATCSTSYIVQARYGEPTQFSPEFDVADSNAIYQQAFIPLMVEIQENAA